LSQILTGRAAGRLRPPPPCLMIDPS